jgi:hypothetical protein
MGRIESGYKKGNTDRIFLSGKILKISDRILDSIQFYTLYCGLIPSNILNKRDDETC